MKTIQEFIDAHNLEMEYVPAEGNPNFPEPREGDQHYLVTIQRGELEFKTPFTMGRLLERGPELYEVLDCLAMDALSVETSDGLSDWAREMGMNDDVEKAVRTYNACKKTGDDLRHLLGDDAYEELLWKTERL